MNIRDYMKKAARTDAPLGSAREHDIHMVMGMVTEAGELADVFKKELAYKKEIDWINVTEELGDMMWYIANFCNYRNINLEDVMEKNIQKLTARYPERFTQDKANNRDLPAERTILESS
jgi:NTP pyrophosphatase (non-canonical NTP hydrolase)